MPVGRRCARIDEYDHKERFCQNPQSIPEGDLSKMIFHTFLFTTSCMMVRKDKLLKAGLFDESLEFWQDYELQIRLCQIGSVGMIRENLTLYRIITKDKERKTNRFDGWMQGVARTKNRLLKAAKGEWIHIHDSDDWVYTDLYDEMVSEWLVRYSDADIVCMDLEINSGERLPLNDMTEIAYCAQISRFIKRSFIKGMTFPEEIRAGDDRYFADEMLTRDPKIVYSGIMAYHYNFPREGSLFDLQVKGMI